MKKFITNNYVLYGLGTLLFFLIWEVVALIINETTMIFPDVIKTVGYVFKLLSSSYTYECILNSLIRTFEGFLIAFFLALLLGILVGKNKYLQTIFKPIITALKAIPTAAMVFLFLVLFTPKNTPIVIVVLISFPILYESVIGGINNIDETILNAASIDAGEKRLSSIFKIRLPLAIPYIIVGISSSLALSFKIEIMAEIIGGSNTPGLGTAIKMSQTNDPSNMVPIFAYSFLAITVVLIVDLMNSVIKKINKNK